MIRECAEIYSTKGAKEAMEYTGASYNAVRQAMSSYGVRCARRGSESLIHNDRVFYAEDVALMFEMFSCGVIQKVIAEYFNTTIASIKSVFSNARQNGFDAYPLRNSQ
jgi:hypothetical protein